MNCCVDGEAMTQTETSVSEESYYNLYSEGRLNKISASQYVSVLWARAARELQ